MKRGLMICALILSACLLSGCVGGEKNVAYITGDIECEVSFAVDDTTYRALVERRGDNTRIIFLEPRSMEKITLVREGDERSASLDGIEISVGIDGLFEIEKFFEYDTRVLLSDFEDGVEQIELERSTGEKFCVQIDGGEPAWIVGELYGERRRIKLIRVVGDMLGEME